ncbi:MAG TPA: apolipoprotein N-acyltransferase [Thermoanaerobaculia bacterium]|nr:apolipoprotein N-acyltransferase [Thermoanaerobaculia bacterium]
MKPGAPASLLWIAVAVAGGAVWGLAFGREPWSIASWVALAPLVVLLGAAGGTGRRFLLGWVHGGISWLVAIPWIVPTLETFGQMPATVATLSLGVLAAYLGLFHGAFAALGAPLWRCGGFVALATLPGLWVALEWLRGWLFGGFPWNLAAHVWLDVPGAVVVAAWIGAWGVSFLIVLANTGMALAVVRRRPAWAVLGVLLPLLVLTLGARWAGLPVSRGAAIPRGAPVSILQPNIPNAVEADWQTIDDNYRRVLAMSEEACVPGALVVWPESAAWPFSLATDAAFREDVTALARRGGCTLLFNSLHPAPGGSFFNSAFVVAPDGVAVRYDKRKLVPFGEYVPFAGVFSFVDKLARNAGDFQAAEELRLLPWAGERLGVAICYEIVFPGQVADAVREGATLLVTITNDAWYGDTAAPWQHYAAARYRAAESRRTVLRAAITGVSAVVAEDGAELARIAPFRQGVIETTALGRRDLTPFTRAPWVVPVLSALLAAGGLLGARVRERRPAAGEDR